LAPRGAQTGDGMTMALSEAEAVAAIEAEMRATMADWRAELAAREPDPPGGAAAVDALYAMMAYHLGWVDQEFRPAPGDGGKKLRGLLCLLACAAAGGDAATALPLAAAVELLHNFTLVHDDIQDRSALRRHRPTVWTLWGIGQAINVGDGLYALARLALARLPQRGVPADLTLALATEAERTLLHILEGQFLDLSFEADWAATAPVYERMIGGKSASLIAYCLEAGGRLGGASEAQAAALRRCGRAIGLGFQVRDDVLGIWGEPVVTGKPPAGDLRARKKSLPVLLAMAAASEADREVIRRAYAQPEPDDAAVAAVLAVLDRTGAQAACQAVVEQRHVEAVGALADVGGAEPAAGLLAALIERLVAREF
jgi:geranylgeranyl diphosphate synthase type I